MKFKIETEHPYAITSPDYISPIGATRDNHCNPQYLSELERIANKKDFSYLDLGCAGGQSVVEVYELGNIACGVEGSDNTKIINSVRWTKRYLDADASDVVSGAENWKKYKNICLFSSDITKDFSILDENNKTQKFDIITAWDVLEHPKPVGIPFVIDNIKKHLKDNGVFITLINTVRGTHHQTIKNRDWWLNQFDIKGMYDIGFDFNASPRHTKNPIDTNDYGFIFKLKKI